MTATSVLDRIGDKWAIFVVVELESGPLRLPARKGSWWIVPKKIADEEDAKRSRGD